jgi:hypothetical protein
VPPGQNYCPQGHPIALEQVQFAPTGAQFGAVAPQPFGVAPSTPMGAKYAQAGAAVVPPQAGPGYAAASPYAAPPQYPPPQVAAPYAPPGSAPAAPYAPPVVAPQYAPPAAAPPFAPAVAAPPFAAAAAVPPYAPPLAAAPPAAEPPYNPAMADTKSAVVIPETALAGFLVSFMTEPTGQFWPLTGGRHTIGRANSGETVDIELPDATISSHHAALTVDALASTIAVEDTASTNGTFVNDEHIGHGGKRDLRDGDRLRLGAYTTFIKIIVRG